MNKNIRSSSLGYLKQEEPLMSCNPYKIFAQNSPSCDTINYYNEIANFSPDVNISTLLDE